MMSTRVAAYLAETLDVMCFGGKIDGKMPIISHKNIMRSNSYLALRDSRRGHHQLVSERFCECLFVSFLLYIMLFLLIFPLLNVSWRSKPYLSQSEQNDGKIDGKATVKVSSDSYRAIV